MEIFKRKQPDMKLLFIFAAGGFLRLFYIGNIPGNRALYVDELMAGYEAWSLLNYGFEYLGYPLPVYLPSWGTGQSLMQALWQMPFIRLFGLNSFSIRLPAAILGCITIYAFYYICVKTHGKDFAYMGTFILAVMPWHIMQSRWALDCNYFVGFITISVALLIKGIEDNRFLPVAYMFFGLSLYTYALPWIIMPFILFSVTIYMLYKGTVVMKRYFIIGVIVLCVTALPLLLFVLVNYGFINEIKTSFFSIPKLVHFRSNEIDLSAKSILERMYETLMLFVNQSDGRITDTTPLFGIYYKFSNFFILIGIAAAVVNAIGNFKSKTFSTEFFILILFVASIFLSGVVNAFFSRINIIHIPMTYFCALGIYRVINSIEGDWKRIVIAVYAISCVAFMIYYFTIYDNELASAFDDGAKYALEYADAYIDENLDKNIVVHCFSGVGFTQVLFYEQYPTDRFVNEVLFSDPETQGGAMIPVRFGRYDFEHAVEGEDYRNAVLYDIYIASDKDDESINYMEDNAMDIAYLSHVVVGICR